MSGGGRQRRVSARARVLSRTGGLLLRLLARTWRVRVVGAHGMRAHRASGRPVIFAFWHRDMLPLLVAHSHEGVAVLVSEHGDGELIARVAESLGYDTVRGSSRRGAERALLGMVRVVREGRDAAFTPDGPRGPAETFAPGALIVAQRTGAPVVLISVDVSRAWRLRSWDGFRIPKPFARITIAYSEPLPVRSASPRAAANEAPVFQNLLREPGKWRTVSPSGGATVSPSGGATVAGRVGARVHG